jgi:hypothetical protein
VLAEEEERHVRKAAPSRGAGLHQRGAVEAQGGRPHVDRACERAVRSASTAIRVERVVQLASAAIRVERVVQLASAAVRPRHPYGGSIHDRLPSRVHAGRLTRDAGRRGAEWRRGPPSSRAGELLQQAVVHAHPPRARLGAGRQRVRGAPWARARAVTRRTPL